MNNKSISNNKHTEDIDVRDAFFDAIYTIALQDPNVIFLTADMGARSLNKFKTNLKDQFINVGVAEQNIVSIAAGLALGGKKVFIYGIASFISQRCYEQIKVDLCCMKLPVVIIGTSPGITNSTEGPTHHAINDIAIMRALPKMTIFSISDGIIAEVAARLAYTNKGPVYIRIGKGKLPLLHNASEYFSDGLSLVKSGHDAIIITTGTMVHQALKIANQLSKHSIDAGIIDIYRLKPINTKALLSLIGQIDKIVTLEEHSIIGGVGSSVSEILIDNERTLPIKKIGFKDEFCLQYGDREWLRSFYGLGVDGIINEILSWVHSKDIFEGGSKSELFELTLEDFADSFGTTVNDISDECRNLIAQANFEYKILDGKKRDKVIMDVLNKIETTNYSVEDPERKNTWQKGWQEIFDDFVGNNYNLNALFPKYIRPNQPIRLNQNYVIPVNPTFELDYLKVFRRWLFKKYFKGPDSIYEFGCGTGHNLVELAKLYPEKKLYGLDFAPASRDLINKIAEIYGYKMTGVLFNMLSPKENFRLLNNNAILTFGTIEQLGGKYEDFLEFLLDQSPRLCMHIEPIFELYDKSNFVDYLGIKLHRKRGYTKGYLSRLQQLESEGKVELIKVKRPFFGDLYSEGYSYIIWRPKKNSESWD